jgi:hypothetical protein
MRSVAKESITLRGYRALPLGRRAQFRRVARHDLPRSFGGDRLRHIARLLFEGRTNTVTLVTLSEATAFQGGLMRVRVSWQDRPPLGGSAALVLHTAVFRADSRLVFERDLVVLFRDVVGFSLRYFGASGPGKPPQWHSEWLGHDQMPLAMLVQVDIAGASGRRQVVLQTTLRHAPTKRRIGTWTDVSVT